MCKETVGEQNGGNFHVFARPWRSNCLAYVEKGALGKSRFWTVQNRYNVQYLIFSGVTILSILMGLASLCGIIHGYRPRNHVSYVIGFRKRTKSMIISLGVCHYVKRIILWASGHPINSSLPKRIHSIDNSAFHPSIQHH